MTVELILPVYNEEGNLRPLLTEIQDALEDPHDYRVLFVNDGSEDRSGEILEELSREYANVSSLHFNENAGQSAAFAAGFRHSTAPLLVTLDSDGQNDPADIPGMIDELGDHEMVAGYRENREDGWLRTLGSRIANWVRNLVTGDDIIDTGCSLKVFRREVVESIPYFEGMHRFLPTLARREGFSVIQVPTNHRPRTHGNTKYTLTGRFFTTIVDLLAVRWLLKRTIHYEVDELAE